MLLLVKMAPGFRSRTLIRALATLRLDMPSLRGRDGMHVRQPISHPLSSLGYGPAPFPLLSPGSPSLMRFRATRCIYVYFETGTVSWVHGDTFSVSAAKHQF